MGEDLLVLPPMILLAIVISASVLKGSQTNMGGFIGLTNTEFSTAEKNVINNCYSNTNFSIYSVKLF